MAVKSLYEEFKDKLPPELPPESINNMSRSLVENLSEEYMARKNVLNNEVETDDLEIEDDIIDGEDFMNEFFPDDVEGDEDVDLEVYLDDEDEVIEEEIQPEPKKIEVKPSKKKTQTKNSFEEYIEREEKEVNLKKELNIVNIDSMTASNSYMRFLKKRIRSTYYLILPNSGYTASVRGLDIEEIDALRNSFTDHYEYKKAIKETIFRCIEESSVHFENIDQFANATAILDLEILLFGIMVKTFGNVSNFAYKCTSCEKDNRMSVDLNSIVMIKNDVTRDIMNNIETSEDPQKPFLESKVRDFERIKLPDTQLMIDIGVPTLTNEESTLKAFRSSGKQFEESRLFVYMNTVKDLFMPYFRREDDEEPSGYTKVTNKMEIYNLLRNMTKKDRDVFDKALEKFYNIDVNFKISNCKCSSCSKDNEVDFNIVENFIQSILVDGI